MGRGFTVLVADDNVLVRDLLHAVLGQSDDFSIVAAAEDADGAIRAAAEHQPDVALVDVRMPGGGPAAARGISSVSPETKVIALSSADDAETVRMMLGAGAVSYVVKGTPSDELLATMRNALDPPTAHARRPLAGPPQRVLVALSDSVALDELAESVMAAPELELVGLAQTAYHALSLAARLRPDIAVVESTMSSGGARLGAAIVAASPATRLIAWTTTDPTARLGADPASALLDAVERANTGAHAVLSPAATVRDLPPSRRRFERLASVLAADDIEIQVQTIVSLADERVRGYEALARFPGHPHPGPDVWFAEAHRAQVGVELERLAVRAALATLEHLPEPSFLAVNVSPDTAIHPGLIDDLGAVDPSRIVVELTEHAPVSDYVALRRGLDALRALGTRVAVDDCGAGFTSLRHVALVAPDFLKLDMVLTRDVREPAVAALARALVGFAAETGSTVIAEGVEAFDDQIALRDLGIELGQGYLFSRPDDVHIVTATHQRS